MTTLLWWIAGGSLVLASAGFSAFLMGYHRGQRRLWEAEQQAKDEKARADAKALQAEIFAQPVGDKSAIIDRL